MAKEAKGARQALTDWGSLVSRTAIGMVNVRAQADKNNHPGTGMLEAQRTRVSVEKCV